MKRTYAMFVQIELDLELVLKLAEVLMMSYICRMQIGIVRCSNREGKKYLASFTKQNFTAR